jgi:hypothetical protein
MKIYKRKHRNDGTVKNVDTEFENFKEDEALLYRETEEIQLNMWIGYLIKILNSNVLDEHEKSIIENSNGGVIRFRYFTLEKNDPINIYNIYIINKFNNTSEDERIKMLSKLPKIGTTNITNFSETTRDKLVRIHKINYMELIENIIQNYNINLDNLKLKLKRKREGIEIEKSKKVKKDGRKSKRRKLSKKKSKRIKKNTNKFF